MLFSAKVKRKDDFYMEFLGNISNMRIASAL